MGDLSYHYKLHKKDLSDATKIEEIKQSIVNLKLSVNSYVIIDLPPKKSFPYLVFFQTARKRSFKHTNYYVYEIRIDISTPHGIQKKMYRADHQRKKDVLQAFEKICIQQTEPDLSEMEDITEKIFGGKKKDRQYDLAENLISQYLHSSLPTKIQQYRYEEALNHLAIPAIRQPSIAGIFILETIFPKTKATHTIAKTLKTSVIMYRPTEAAPFFALPAPTAIFLL